jgi:hypothetical protein
MSKAINIYRQLFEFNKSGYEAAVRNMSVWNEQIVKLLNQYIDQSVGISDPGKKAAKECTAMYKKGCDDFQKLMDENYRKIEMFFREKNQMSKQ